MSIAIRPIPSAASAELIGDRVVVHELEVSDPDVVGGAKRFVQSTGQTDVIAFVVGVLELGGKALSLAGTSMDVGEIRRSVDKLAIQVVDSTEQSVAAVTAAVQQVTGEDEGSLLRGVSTILDGLKRGLEDLLTGEDGPVRASISKTITATTDSALAEVQRVLAAHQQVMHEVLSSDNPSSPLSGLRTELLRSQSEYAESVQRQLADIETMLEVSTAVQKVIASTALKGGSYEEHVMARLDAMCKGAGDVLERTGALAGLNGRAKKGDGVVSVDHPIATGLQARLVVEAKNQSLSLAAWRRELDEAKKNRGATAALGLVRSCELMPGGDRLRVIDSLTYILAFDPASDDDELLLAAYQLLRIQALSQLSDAGDEVDVLAVQKCVAKALEALADFDKITRAARLAINQVGGIATTADGLREELVRSLQTALALLTSSSGAAPLDKIQQKSSS